LDFEAMVRYEKKTDRVTKPEGKAAIIAGPDLDRLFGPEGLATDRDRALFGVCRFTACRINEACQLTADDVFTPTGQVRQQITFRARTTKGGYGGKTVRVADELRTLLEAYGSQGKLHLFPGRHGRGHISPISASAIFKEVCDRLGLEHASTHSLRRTAINRMREAGWNLEVIQSVSGHRSLDGLSQYLAVSEGDKASAVACL
jgi:integrase/recombinase XerD